MPSHLCALDCIIIISIHKKKGSDKASKQMPPDPIIWPVMAKPGTQFREAMPLMKRKKRFPVSSEEREKKVPIVGIKPGYFCVPADHTNARDT